MSAVVPRWITAFLISSKDGASIGYIVWTDSDILTSSMLLILSESTVTWTKVLSMPMRLSDVKLVRLVRNNSGG